MARDFPDSFEPLPIDRVAARVLSSGYHHEFTKKNNNRETWDVPPETIPLFQVPEVIKSLFNSRKGSLVVVGYLGRHKNERGNKGEQRLLVRCDCGRYEVRTARGWRKVENAIYEWCQFCDQREKLKISHLSDAERDRLDDLKRKRAGLVPKLQAANDRRKEWSERQLGSLLERNR